MNSLSYYEKYGKIKESEKIASVREVKHGT
mgnify:CR=1 FL=1